ncbi:DoxX family protein [Methylobacterium nigriterrae]|uniref:DoxX family protein n=1 Tax=Methylobacterium nigriterrae TaxID=3127512 RepID=UPI00301379C2
MAALSTRLNGYAPYALALLRIMAGLLFLAHGSQKLLGLPPRTGPAPELTSLFGIGGVMELVGGALIVLGLFTRPVAFLLCGEMAFAYFMVHAPKNFFPALNGGDSAILFCFVFLYLAAAGPGAFSLDAGRRRA